MGEGEGASYYAQTHGRFVLHTVLQGTAVREDHGAFNLPPFCATLNDPYTSSAQSTTDSGRETKERCSAFRKKKANALSWSGADKAAYHVNRSLLWPPPNERELLVPKA